MYLIMYKTLLLYKYFGNKELKLCQFIHFPSTHVHLHNIPLELECRVAILSFTDYISITQI